MGKVLISICLYAAIVTTLPSANAQSIGGIVSKILKGDERRQESLAAKKKCLNSWKALSEAVKKGHPNFKTTTDDFAHFAERKCTDVNWLLNLTTGAYVYDVSWACNGHQECIDWAVDIYEPSNYE